MADSIKVLGGRNLPPYWDRFDRLQRTAARLLQRADAPRGVYRFESHAEAEAWTLNRSLNRPARPSAPTSLPSADH